MALSKDSAGAAVWREFIGSACFPAAALGDALDDGSTANAPAAAAAVGLLRGDEFEGW